LQPITTLRTRSSFDRCGDDHLAHPPIEVRREQLGGAELAGALQHDVDVGGRPRHLARRRDRRVADRRAVDLELTVAHRDGSAIPSVDGVELQQVRRRRGVGERLVDVHEFEIALLA
jgi:hypothetical protein